MKLPTSDQIDFKDLTKKGYFPQGIPNIFTTSEFGEWANQQPVNYVELKHVFRAFRYSISKRNGQRRVLSIPNPHNMFNIQVFFEKHSAEILRLAKASPQSLSAPQKSTGRCVTITPHRELSQERFKKLSAYKYIAYVDISRFYHSIYTHSLPWAAHGKPAAKKDFSPKSSKIYFNQIDQIVRNGQDGQTIGIPVGPDSSRVLSEIVNAAIDQEFTINQSDAVFIRHVDDVWIGANSFDDAKLYLHEYRHQLLEYELEINETKTRIHQNHLGISDAWPIEIDNEIQRIFAAEDDRIRGRNLLHLFQVCFDRSNSAQDDAIVRYVIKRLDEFGLFTSVDDWENLESFLLQCALHFPHTIDYVARIIAWRALTNQSYRKSEWQKVIETILDEHSKLKNDSEVLWSLWLCFHTSIKIDKLISAKIARMKSDFCAVMLFVLSDKKLISNGLDKSTIIANFDIDNVSGTNWLLAHEIRVQEWLPPNKLTTTNDSKLLEALRASKISFIDLDLLPPVFYTDDGGDIDDPNTIKSAIEVIESFYDPIELAEQMQAILSDDPEI